MHAERHQLGKTQRCRLVALHAHRAKCKERLAAKGPRRMGFRSRPPDSRRLAVLERGRQRGDATTLRAWHLWAVVASGDRSTS